MGNILILNGSPRAPKSNSRRYAEIFSQACACGTEYLPLTPKNHLEVCGRLPEFTDVLLAFPLYADSLPVSLLRFLKTLEENPPAHKPVISVLINCGFLEPQQNDVAVRMVRLFCAQNGYRFGSVLEIGGGEAILDTPFRFLAARKIRKLAACIARGKHRTLRVTMPLSRKMFLKASASYWTRYGEKNGVTREQMETMQIESQGLPGTT